MVTVSFIFLIVLASVTLVFSNRLQRQVRRFIDRNFYVNRYDYRAQWYRVTRSMEPSQRAREVIESAEALFREVFLADEVTVALRDRSGNTIRPHAGKGRGNTDAVLFLDSPLGRKLHQERNALLLDRQVDDMEYIPIYVENKEWLDQTASQVVAPLLVGQELRGVVGLERKHPDDRFGFEDLDLLDCMAGQVGAVIRSVELAQDLAESREMELLSQWSSLILHDLKNYLSPLRLIVQNMRVHMGNPDFQKEAVEDLSAVADRMERLIKRLSELREGGPVAKGSVELNELITRTLTALQLYRRTSLTVNMQLAATEPVRGDASMLRRVVENLVTNAVEAMDGQGTLTVRTETRPDLGNGVPKILLIVTDTGPGMDDLFLREKLFRPFASTKKKGLGLGLYQSQSIVAAHGGEIQVESAPGQGTTFRVALPAVRRIAPRPVMGQPTIPKPPTPAHRS